MNPTLVLNLVLIQAQMIVLNAYERTRPRSLHAKALGSIDSNAVSNKKIYNNP